MTRTKWLLLAGLTLLQVVDLLSTRLALLFGMVELNPVVRSLGLWQAKLLAFAVILVLGVRCKRTWALWAALGYMVVVVGWNLSLALR